MSLRSHLNISSADPDVRRLDFDFESPVICRLGFGFDSPTPPRRRSIFIDDAAVESDGEGGDISSTASSPEVINLIYPSVASVQSSTATQY